MILPTRIACPFLCPPGSCTIAQCQPWRSACIGSGQPPSNIGQQEKVALQCNEVFRSAGKGLHCTAVVMCSFPRKSRVSAAAATADGHAGGNTNGWKHDSLDCPFTGCLFTRCLFTGCLRTACLFTDCLFTDCLFAGCLFPRCLFTGCLFPDYEDDDDEDQDDDNDDGVQAVSTICSADRQIRSSVTSHPVTI